MNYNQKYIKYKNKYKELKKLQIGGQFDKLKDLLTVVITTSPIQSNPDTTLFMKTFDSINMQKDLDKCKKLVYCDGYKIKEDDNAKALRKKGQIHSKDIDSYLCFIDKLKRLNLSNTEIIEQPQRYGFAENVRQSLDKITTPLIMVVQHDHYFSRDVNISDVATKMFKNLDNINYIGFPSVSVDNLVKKYDDKPYIKFKDDLKKLINIFLQLFFGATYYNRYIIATQS